MTIETQRPITINIMDTIEKALSYPKANVFSPEERIDELQELMKLVAGRGVEHAEHVLGIAYAVLIDVRIATKRTDGTFTPVKHMRRESDINPVTYTFSYADRLSQQLRGVQIVQQIWR